MPKSQADPITLRPTPQISSYSDVICSHAGNYMISIYISNPNLLKCSSDTLCYRVSENHNRTVNYIWKLRYHTPNDTLHQNIWCRVIICYAPARRGGTLQTLFVIGGPTVLNLYFPHLFPTPSTPLIPLNPWLLPPYNSSHISGDYYWPSYQWE